MKRFASLFYVFAAIASFGPAAGDETTATECTIEIEDGKSKNDTMYEMVERCESAVDYSHMGEHPSAELIRETMTGYCGKRPQLRRCLDGLDEDARRCLDATEQTRHRLLRQFIQLALDVHCEMMEEDMVEAYRRDEEAEDNAIKLGCAETARGEAVAAYTDGVNGFMLYTYAGLHEATECLESHKGQGDDELLDWLIAEATNLMNRIKCVKDDVDVLCKTIVDAHQVNRSRSSTGSSVSRLR